MSAESPQSPDPQSPGFSSPAGSPQAAAPVAAGGAASPAALSPPAAAPQAAGGVPALQRSGSAARLPTPSREEPGTPSSEPLGAGAAPPRRQSARDPSPPARLQEVRGLSAAASRYLSKEGFDEARGSPDRRSPSRDGGPSPPGPAAPPPLPPPAPQRAGSGRRRPPEAAPEASPPGGPPPQPQRQGSGRRRPSEAQSVRQLAALTRLPSARGEAAFQSLPATTRPPSEDSASAAAPAAPATYESPPPANIAAFSLSSTSGITTEGQRAEGAETAAAARLRHLMERTPGLERFYPVLAEQGFDDAATLEQAGDADLERLGLGQGHRIKLRSLLRAASPPGTPPPPPPPAAAPAASVRAAESPAPSVPSAAPPAPSPLPGPVPAPAPAAPLPPPLPAPTTPAPAPAPAPAAGSPSPAAGALPPPPFAEPVIPPVVELDTVDPAAADRGVAAALELHGDAVLGLAADVANWRDEAAASVARRGGGGAETVLIALRHLAYHLRQQEALREVHRALGEGLLGLAEDYAPQARSSGLSGRLCAAAAGVRELLPPERPSEAPARLLAEELRRECAEGLGEDGADPEAPAVDAVLGALAGCCERQAAAGRRPGPLGAHGRGLAVVLRAALRQRRQAAEQLTAAAEALRAERELAAAQVAASEQRREAETARLREELRIAERCVERLQQLHGSERLQQLHGSERPPPLGPMPQLSPQRSAPGSQPPWRQGSACSSRSLPRAPALGGSMRGGSATDRRQ